MANLTEPDWSTVAMPTDDGATDHLQGASLPAITLQDTNGAMINLSALSGIGVLYIYPRTGRPDQALPTGWDDIPGARGCTPQSCSFRDHFAELQELGIDYIYGLSTQDSDYQKEAVERLHLPFPLLSDKNLAFAKALDLPTFTIDGMELIKRMSLIIEEGRIVRVSYPIFPPDQDAATVVAYLEKMVR